MKSNHHWITQIHTKAQRRGNMEEIVLGGGCFWCIEGGLADLSGTIEVTPGYSGGHVANPTYQQVCGKKTGHAEVVKVKYNPDVISLDSLLEVFFTLHDPTQIDRQGNDVGPHYRTCIFYNTTEQGDIARNKIDSIRGDYDKAIATTVEPLEKFWPAEIYHHDYFQKNPNQPYCSFVVAPKIAKAKNMFSELYE